MQSTMRSSSSFGVLGVAVAFAAAAACGTNDLQPIRSPDVADAAAPGVEAGGADDAGAPRADGAAPEASASDTGVVTPTRKRGLAYGYNSDADLAALSAGIGWWYNWSPKPDGTLAKGYAGLGLEFVPMVWGGTFDVTTLAAQVPPDAKYLLTFNEPNFGAQSNLTPAQAAALWPKIESFAASRGMKIVSPAVNYCGSPCNDTDPFDWLQKFFDACTGCQIDYVAMHWYACDKPALLATLPKYEKFGKPLWLTEFSCLDDKTKVTDADELAYMKDAVAVLEADPMVFRYAWFTGRSTGSPPISVLGANSGDLTPLGTQYVSLPR
jgi:Glycosyl hydrolase catalytic core